MANYNFNNKKFTLLQNTDNGQVDSKTIFEYKQDGNLVTADYFGGSIKYGKIIAKLKGNKLNMLYQCLTTDNELKAGKAVADITLSDNGKLKLSLVWEWLTDKNEKGRSEYVEI
ncbi:hypothetical protein [Ulvibacterium marinum]|uniref:N-acetylglutamate synthase n=1 Tax=Ulvibacterium marinum TaxID=2419782 RepID=A0A3B0CBL9_9FLAO|nr:hypothetical protein [Ulvibacterium marinum]RKN81047.1 hypothetical protein D7Z94_08840 [Ulvibacterium marinum]